MTDNRHHNSDADWDRFDSFPSYDEGLVVYDREEIDAWLLSDCWVELPYDGSSPPH